ncbi:MAG: hypothetical protein GEU93_02515 [Propionibacteriales bacterium]|nr:hypothetical protein [Propionibacteriales bacterium]
MSFIQIIEHRADDFDKLRALEEEWEKATEGKSTARRAIVTEDRNEPGHYFSIVFFDSYESAMVNSNLPETQEMAAKLAAASKEPATFYDLDVVDDRSPSGGA